MTDHDIKKICDRPNNTRGKCLGWKAPAGVFREKKMEEMDKAPTLKDKRNHRLRSDHTTPLPRLILSPDIS